MAGLDRPIPASAFETLLVRAQPQLRRILGHYRIPPADGEDLVQQTFMALVYNWSSIRSPLPWVLGTLRRHCLMYRRQQRRRPFQNVEEGVLEWLSRPVDAPQERAGMLKDIERALHQLPERCQTILRLRYGLGYRLPEVADRLGYRVSSMSKITQRCLESLSRQLTSPALTGVRRRPPPH